MNTTDSVAVCSRSFSRNPVLRSELLSRYQNVTFNDSGSSLEGSSLISFLQGHTKAITALETIDDSILSCLPELRVIGKYGVGLDMIDLPSLAKHGVSLGWTGGVNRRSVSELVIAFAISLLRLIPQSNADVIAGNWKQHVGSLLSGKTIGIIGCGFIGKDLVRLLSSWGCNFLANDILDYSEFYDRYDVISVSLNELLSQSDIVTLHTPLNPSTYHILNKSNMNLMKSNSVLINTARGGLVDEDYLYHMLSSSLLAGAAFDVLENEPPSNCSLFELDNFFVTPHIGGSAKEVILEMGRAAINGLESKSIPSL